MKKDYDERNKARDLAIAKMGELMLAGGALLGAICPSATCRGMPLVRLHGGPMTCVSCENNYEYDTNQDIRLLTDSSCSSSKNVPSTVTDDTTAPAIVSSTTADIQENIDIKDDDFYLIDAPVLSAYRNDSSNDASSKIAKYLVEGKCMVHMFTSCCTFPSYVSI